MNWTTSPKKLKCWNKAYKEYAIETCLTYEDLSNWIKANPFVALRIEEKAIEFLKENQL